MISPTVLGAFHRWLDLGPAGSAFVYHTGHLAEDRVRLIWDGAIPRWMAVDPADQLGSEAWGAYERDLALLCQHRVGPNRFEYLAVKKG